MGNVVTRRDYLLRQMIKEFPNKTIQELSQAITELEYEYPKTNWDQKVYYDSGRPVSQKPIQKRKPNTRAKRPA